MKLKEHEGLMKTEAIKAKATDLVIAGIAMLAYQMPEGHYKLSLSQLAEALSVQPTQLRRLSALQNLPITALKVSYSKGLSALQNEQQRRNKGMTMQSVLLSTEDIAKALLEFTLKGNVNAAALMQALVTEAFDRRCDYAFGIKKTEVEYEASLANLYRRLRDEHKKQYIPYLTHWTKVDYPNGCAMNYKVRTNQLKRAGGFDDCVSVDEMTTEQLLKWNAAEIRYDAFRRAGYWHERALKEIATSV